MYRNDQSEYKYSFLHSCRLFETRMLQMLISNSPEARTNKKVMLNTKQGVSVITQTDELMSRLPFYPFLAPSPLCSICSLWYPLVPPCTWWFELNSDWMVLGKLVNGGLIHLGQE